MGKRTETWGVKTTAEMNINGKVITRQRLSPGTKGFEPQTRVPTLEVLTGKMSTQNIQH